MQHYNVRSLTVVHRTGLELAAALELARAWARRNTAVDVVRACDGSVVARATLYGELEVLG